MHKNVYTSKKKEHLIQLILRDIAQRTSGSWRAEKLNPSRYIFNNRRTPKWPASKYDISRTRARTNLPRVKTRGHPRQPRWKKKKTSAVLPTRANIFRVVLKCQARWSVRWSVSGPAESWRTGDPLTPRQDPQAFPCKFSLYHFSVAHRARRPRPLFLSRGFVLARTRPRVFGYTYTEAPTYTNRYVRVPHDEVHEDGGGGEGKRIRGKTFTATAGCTSKHACQPLLVFTEQQSDIFLLRQSTRLSPSPPPPPSLPPDRAHCLALSAAKVAGGRS